MTRGERYQAFLWNANQGILPIGPPDRYSSAIALNDHAHVVVQAFSEIFLYVGGSLARLELSPLYPNQPSAMNNCESSSGLSVFRPFCRRRAGIRTGEIRRDQRGGASKCPVSG